MIRSLADDVMDMLLEEDRVVEEICRDCAIVTPSGECPVEYDFYHGYCPQRHYVENLESALRATLANYGLR